MSFVINFYKQFHKCNFGKFEVISSNSYLERNLTKEPCLMNFYFLERIDQDMRDYEKCFGNIIILPGFWHR